MKKLIFVLTLICLAVFSLSCEKEIPASVEMTDAPTEIVEEPIIEIPPASVSFIACGDNITYGTKDARSKAFEGGRQYNFKPQYKEVQGMIEEADIAFINQEVPMASNYPLSYYPRFNAPQELGLDLVEMGYDVVNIATNHMLDKNADGLQSTIDFWKSLDTLMIGGYENREDFDTIRTLEKNGITFAFLSYTEMTNGLFISPSSSIVVPYINDEDIIRQSALAKEVADFVIVSVHWGNEGAFVPSDEQRRVAQLFADCGVDVVVGHHPHVLQPIEWINGDNGEKCLCIFSLGNFVAQQEYDFNAVGGIVELEFMKKENGDKWIETVLFHPTVFHFADTFYTNCVYFMDDYTEELSKNHGVSKYYGNSFKYEKLIKYAKETISEEFLTENFVEVFREY